VTSRRQGARRWPWTDWPLNRLFAAITVSVLLFLSAVLVLGVRQYLLYHQCRQAVAAGDRLLFQFTAIKDHLDGSLIVGEEVNLHALDAELQSLEKEVGALAANILVPEGLKRMLPSRVDLVGLEVRLRAVQENRPQKIREAAELVRSLGGINVGLQQFRFSLSDHTQIILLGLHKIIAGALGLIVVVSCSLLFVLNRRLAGPILALCRLTAAAGPDEEDSSCSLHTLTDRIRQLLDREREREQSPAPAAPTTPDQLRLAALRYRYGVTGWIGTELASELTNRINGVINYTQALIDLNEQGKGDRQQMARVCELLASEEKKTAELVGALQRICQWQPARTSSVSLRTLFHLLGLIFEKSLRAESILLTLPADCDAEAAVAAGDLWLVALTLVEQGRRILLDGMADPPGEKRLHIECRKQPGERFRLTLLFTNSAGLWEAPLDPVWPSLSFCTHLLQVHDASLTLEASDGGTLLLLELPCRGSVA